MPDDRPDPTNILRDVRRNFPDRPLQVDGDLTAKNRRGDILLTRRLEFTLDLSAPTGTALYVLSDAFGEPLERLVITRPPNAPAQYALFSGKDSEAAALHDPTAPIQGLDFSWADLAMDFLWWPNVSIAGHENKLNRPCVILEVRPDASSDAGTYDSVRLWIDQNSSALLEAQGFDAEGALLKKLQIQTLKKVDAFWTVGDIGVHSYPSRSKTRLRVRDVQLENHPPLIQAGPTE
ncbi:MAG: outer membrane lipoprotein-sorting protein [Kiritimatiellae bacterium]|nr:outer membrane lipoprotein-sorting protein [Kiritimatiellia bacterium]